MNELKQRILANWNWQRALYLAVGLLVLISALADFSVLGIVAGGYFSAMAIFGFGCASGQCAIPESELKTKSNG